MQKFFLCVILMLASFNWVEAGLTQLDVRHREPKGIGYQNGYTTLEFLLQPNSEIMGGTPFLDLRCHVFNNGKMAGNAGLGARYLLKRRMYGWQAYYDVRETKKKNFHQVAFGFSTLGLCWDLFVNGYCVVGAKQSKFYDTKFDHFQNHNAYLKRKSDGALSGTNAEVGYHFLTNPKWDAYLGAGPYYYKGSHTSGIFGGKARLNIKLWDYFTMEGNTSYDHTFGWIGQAMIGLQFSLGPSWNTKKNRNSCLSCCEEKVLYSRLINPPNHNEIIPIKTHSKTELMIDPVTGQPFFFVFVNNTSSSDGTFESPYPTLALAAANSNPRDIIYVFPGNGITTGMDEGITLQNLQQLWGSGVDQTLNTTLGTIVIPAQTPGFFPLLTNTLVASGSGVVILANDNVVSGIHTTLPVANSFTGNDGITANSISNATLIKNIATNGVRGISLLNCVGSIDIEGNNTDGSLLGISIINNTSSSQHIQNATITGNIVQNSGARSSSTTSATGINYSMTGDVIATVLISSNTITNTVSRNGGAILVFGSHNATGDPIVNFTVDHNTIMNSSGIVSAFPTITGGNGIELRNLNQGTVSPGPSLIGSITENIITDGSGPSNSGGIKIDNFTNSGFGLIQCIADKNTIQNNVVPGIYVTNPGSAVDNSATFLLEVQNNRLSGNLASEFISQSTNSDSSICLGLSGNSSDQPYNLTQANNGIFRFESPTLDLIGVQNLNTGTITTSGSITFVEPGSCQ